MTEAAERHPHARSATDEHSEADVPLFHFRFQLGRSRDGDYCHIGGFHVLEDATPWRQNNESRPIPLPRAGANTGAADDDRPP